MVALRQKGMQDRHWAEITKRMGFDVKPNVEFTFTKALEMGLMKEVDFCVEVGERAAKVRLS